MSVLNDKPAVGVAVAVIALATAGFLAWRNNAGVRGVSVTAIYHYDLDSGELTAVPVGEQPPANMVLAHVYACGACTEGNLQLLSIERMTGRARQLMQRRNSDANPDGAQPGPPPSSPPLSVEEQMAITAGTLVAAPPSPGKSPQWFQQGSPEAMSLTTRALTLCDGEPAERCHPEATDFTRTQERP